MKTQLSFATAYAVQKVFGDFLSADFQALGITPMDWELLKQSTPWRRDQTQRVLRTISAVVYGTLEVMNMPKFNVPAEFVACTLAATVHPGNMFVACQWLAYERLTGVPADDLAERTTTGWEQSTPEQLLALVLKLMNSDANEKARKDFEYRVGVAASKEAQTATTPGMGRKK